MDTTNKTLSLKKIIKSLSRFGSKSECLPQFVDFCKKISLTYFKYSKYRDLIRTKTGLQEDDLAYDFIADLFREEDDSYTKINSHFIDVLGVIDIVPEDLLVSKLTALVCSATNQRISEIREDFGESYFKIKKAIDIAITRNGDIFKETILRDIIYIHNSSTANIEFDKEQVPKEWLIQELHGLRFRTRTIPEVLRGIFNILDKQNTYCKAIEFTSLVQFVVEFYKQRFNDYVLRY